MTTTIVIDASPGCDAAGALAWAAMTAEVDLVAAIGTWGNVTAPQAAANALRILELCESQVPVHVGEDSASGPAPGGAPASMVYGIDGLGDVGAGAPIGTPASTDGAAAIVEAARAQPGMVTLVCCGPLSTLAAALDLEPELPSLLAGLTCMAGAVEAGGNMTPLGEANVAHDPLAGQRVVDAFGVPGVLANGSPPRLVPLDRTLTCVLADEDLELLSCNRAPWAQVLHKIWSAVWPIGTMETGGLGWPAHDLLTTIAAVHPEVCTWETLPIAVDTGGGAAWGATAVDRRLRGLDAAFLEIAEAVLPLAPARWAIAMDADRDAFRTAIRGWMV